MVKIDNIELGDFPLLLAPMEDVSDPPFRALCKKYGADMMYTEFISSEGLIRDAVKSMQKLDIFEYERPIGIQIFGSEISSMRKATEVCQSANPDIIDINYGCPVKKVACKGAGAGILQDIPKMVEMTKDGGDIFVAICNPWGIFSNYEYKWDSIYNNNDMTLDAIVWSSKIKDTTHEYKHCHAPHPQLICNWISPHFEETIRVDYPTEPKRFGFLFKQKSNKTIYY